MLMHFVFKKKSSVMMVGSDASLPFMYFSVFYIFFSESKKLLFNFFNLPQRIPPMYKLYP